jgi:hypothetical protein
MFLDFRGVSAHMEKPNSSPGFANFSLDKDSGKKRRGPKPKVVPSWLRGRADNWRSVLPQVWPKLWPALEKANTEAEVLAALDFARPYQDYFVSHPALILSILKDSKFPTSDRGRINFLADSAAGFGVVTPRRSRDICAAERAAARKKGQILRYEYYIECSCGYKGHSTGHGCPDCEAAILFPIGLGIF